MTVQIFHSNIKGERGAGQAREHNQDIEKDAMASEVRGSMPLRCPVAVLKLLLTFLHAHNSTDTLINKLKSLL